MNTCIISDSACLIALDRIDKLSILKTLYHTIYIPEAVQKEFGKTIDWIEVKAIQNQAVIRTLQTQIDFGESEVIALALELNEPITILDDKKARKIAKDLGIKVIGTIGLLLKAKKVGVIPKVKPLLDELKNAGFHISEMLYKNALLLANE